MTAIGRVLGLYGNRYLEVDDEGNVDVTGDLLKDPTIIDLYANPSTGNDSTNDGSQSSPFATMDKLLEVYEDYVNEDLVRFNLATGTYTGNFDLSIRKNNLDIIGDNTTPSNVVFAAEAVDEPIINIDGYGGIVSITGIKTQGATESNGINIGNHADVEIGKINCFNNLYGIYIDTLSTLQFITGYSGTTIDGNDIENSEGILATRGSKIFTYQDITMQKVNTGLFTNNQSSFTCSSAVTTTINLSNTVDNYAGILNRNYSYLFLNGTLSIEGNAPDSNNLGIQSVNSKVDFVSASTINLNNLLYGIQGTNKSIFSQGNATVTFNYTGCTHNAALDESCVSNTDFDTTIEDIEDIDNTYDLTYQSDKRYTRQISQSVADDGTITLTTSKTGILRVFTDSEYAECFIKADGTVTLLYNSANVANTDSDTNLCIYDGGTGAVIKNRLGDTKTVTYKFEAV